MSASFYLMQCREAFDNMCAERRRKPMGKRLRLPERVLTLTVTVYESEAARIDRLAHEASDALLADPAYIVLCAANDRALAEILAECTPGIPGLVEPDAELIAHGFLEPIVEND